MVKAGFVEWPDGLTPFGAEWDAIRRAIESDPPAVLITNEMPFGDWIAASAFDPAAADRCVALHEEGLAALAGLGISAILSSRPIWQGERLVNEAFVLLEGKPHPLHQKRYFPAEPGWYESDWFVTGKNEFAVRPIAGLETGVLLCTEVMFNQHAREYGEAKADLIAVPRATGEDHGLWRTACSMAAIVSGSYVISSNRSGRGSGGPDFGGCGMAFAPDGSLIAETSSARPYRTVELDAAWSRRQKSEYPCYVKRP
ncbi:MAG TPA: carbon-nitrogen hydrolase family protein [Terriglobia bacterium]|nr:carbon-nitrogen hydrolase family protein [Terriglobia bacterium]